ncbi:MAG: hypothetical protein DMG26_09155 [Acidobacteria bacterium]|nr:MAG: hypothetical protein DMG25_00840 [Acidobacteriota bacterium]PYV03631.1 MAG: hypothetical protein DMG26_09155 [Acidobacteriota bacterium]PYV25375.1 MAG: hypothetical protein DMG27_10025 [Acidobacteriota bacterium]
MSTGFLGAARLTSTIRAVSVTPWVAAAGRQKAEGSRRRAVGSRQKAVGRRQRAMGQRAIGNDQRAPPALFSASGVVCVAISNLGPLPFASLPLTCFSSPSACCLLPTYCMVRREFPNLR